MGTLGREMKTFAHNLSAFLKHLKIRKAIPAHNRHNSLLNTVLLYEDSGSFIHFNYFVRSKEAVQLHI